MGRISKGILGPVSGTVGTVIGGSWKGIHYLRSQPAKGKGTSSVDQIDHQLKFATVVSFVQPMTGVVTLTFKKYAVGMSEYNAAFSYNYANALTGKTPDYSIDYSKALVSRGDLPNATAPAASITGNTVFFTWTDNSGVGKATATDTAVLVAYCEDQKTTLFSNNAAVRGDGAGKLDVTNFGGSKIQTWVAFLSADDKEASNSIYTGELIVG